VTLIATDGRVIGDSSQDPATLAQLENHRDRPEVVDATQRGLGVATRFSATLGVDMLYVAARVGHPAIATIRLALPLTEVDRQVETIWRAAMYALAVSVAGASALAWIASTVLVRRLTRLAVGARRYAAGEAAAPPADHEDDEIGTVARVLEDAVRQLGVRASDLARDRARLEAILTGMVEGVVVVDPAQRVQLVNAAARQMLRIDRDPIGCHVLECVRHPAVVSQLTRALSGESSPTAEPGVVQDGARVFLARAAPIAGPGGAVLVLHDITELQRADQIRRDFVANVSHELRTPLTAIRGYVEAMTDEPIDADERHKFLEIIARHTARMERLTMDLLRLARLEAGEERLEYSRCRIAELFDNVIADLRPRIQQRQQRVEIAVEPGAEAFAADTQQLQDAIRNLVENAVIYSGDGTTITLGARRDNGRVLITVADEGPGIPSGDLKRVFERFYRVDKARSRDSGGTGLGLAIVKHTVQRMEGSVRVENRPTGGAVFTIELAALPDLRT
jgi:two-component system phosphate regulon sensor histidine kinase PhoR